MKTKNQFITYIKKAIPKWAKIDKEYITIIHDSNNKKKPYYIRVPIMYNAEKYFENVDIIIERAMLKIGFKSAGSGMGAGVRDLSFYKDISKKEYLKSYSFFKIEED